MLGAWFVIASLCSALAGEGTASAPLPPPPPVEFDTLADAAEVRPANTDGSPHQAIARLLVDRAPVVAGEPFRLGVQLTPDAGWHSYWRAPGDIGLPLQIAWTLPQGATVTEPVFPVPQRFEQSGIVSYGYDGPVVLFSEVTLPVGTTGPVTVAADTDWLVCEAQCIPGKAALSLTLDVGGPSRSVPWSALFDHYAALHPTSLVAVTAFAVEGAVSQTAFRPEDPFEAVFRLTPTSGAKLGLHREAGAWPAFTPIIDGYEVFVDGVEVTETPEGGLLAVVRGEVIEVDPLPAQSTVGGLFQVEVDGVPVAAEYTTTWQWAAKEAEVAPSGAPLFGLVRGGAAPVEGTEVYLADVAAPPSTVLMLGFAFLGGVLLNVMPCVFPVILLKLFTLCGHADCAPGTQRRAGLAYTAGVLVSFWALALAVLAIKATMGTVGWGFQFQSPVFVAMLATIVFAFGLSLFGVFEVPTVGVGAAADASARGGLAGDFFNGVFATLLATPCTAPFLGTAIGFAFLQSAPVVVLFFTVIGLGLATPFLLITLVPALFRMLPRPGPWMETFKQLMGFTLIATTIWLVDVLGEQVGPEGATGFLAFLAFVALGGWVFGRWGGLEQTGTRQLGALAVAVAVAVVGGWVFLDLDVAEAAACDDGSVPAELSFDEAVPWQPFSEARIAAVAGRPVFIDFTASWCLTCKVNERTVLESEAVRAVMAEHGVVPLRADWTRRDPVISEWLRRYGRAGVPFYLVLPADPGLGAIPLPEVITSSMVIEALERAAAE